MTYHFPFFPLVPCYPENSTSFQNRKYLELFAIYILLPSLFYLNIFPVSKILFLLVLSILLFFVLAFDSQFNYKSLISLDRHSTHISTLMVRFLLSAIVLMAIALILAPESFFTFPISKPIRWIQFSFLYFIFSVIPQELLYRVYFYHRFEHLFSNRFSLIVINSMLFAFVHIVYHNFIAVAFTLIGGYFFSSTYTTTRSFIIISIEHFMYGYFIFSCGFERFFS